MKNECNKLHEPSYTKTCCLRHLLEMSKYAEMQTKIKKYSKLLLITLNHAYRDNSFNFKQLKLEILLFLLEVISKYISHFYMIKKYHYSKLLGLVAHKAFEQTAFKTNPEVIIRICAINNDIACMYESKKKYIKAYKYIFYTMQFIGKTNSIDKAICLNNLIKIGMLANKKKEMYKYIEDLDKCLKEQMNIAKQISIKETISNKSLKSI